MSARRYILGIFHRFFVQVKPTFESMRDTTGLAVRISQDISTPEKEPG
jgi:hypothetical protein